MACRLGTNIHELNMITPCQAPPIRAQFQEHSLAAHLIDTFRSILTVVLLCAVQSSAFAEESEILSMEARAFQHDLYSARKLAGDAASGEAIQLKRIEAFAEDIVGKWRSRNKAQYARLILEICKPLSSHDFKDERRYEIARRYALLVLSEPDAIPLGLELELTGHVITTPPTLDAANRANFAVRRIRDVEVRLHAWRRLVRSINPAWNPDAPLVGGNLPPPPESGLPAGVDPSAIEDPTLRAQYEATLQENRRKLEEYREQYEIRKWLARYPKRVEQYIVDLYSCPPHNTAELENLLSKYDINSTTRRRVLEAVKAAIVPEVR